MNTVSLSRPKGLFPVPPAQAARRIVLTTLWVALAAVITLPARADQNLRPAQALPIYQQECAACHMAYPPGFLPAASWSRIMNGLGQHYGTDASMDAATVQQISRWLRSEAGTYKRVAEAPPQDRITRSAWFERKHRQIDPQVFKSTAVKGAANCMACHTRADKGEFDDDNVTFPAGLDPRYRKGWGESR